jgi:TetR/AcrR family transcriptional regulator, copper-responsive repressor
MVGNCEAKRPVGRPLAFDPEVALDRAVLVFWEKGYAGADTETLARAMGITKPSIYGTFGTKEQLFLKALHRYGDSIGNKAFAALTDAKNIREGVASFFTALVGQVSGDFGPCGCLIACVAASCCAEMESVREFSKSCLADTDQAIADIFAKAIVRGELPASFPAAQRASLMVDLMQGLAIRGRAGFSKAELSAMANEANAAVLGPS